jgi:hypothetical protein
MGLWLAHGACWFIECQVATGFLRFLFGSMPWHNSPHVHLREVTFNGQWLRASRSELVVNRRKGLEFMCHICHVSHMTYDFNNWKIQ